MQPSTTNNRYFLPPKSTRNDSTAEQSVETEKAQLQSAKKVTRSLKDKRRRKTLEIKLQQGLEDLNLVSKNKPPMGPTQNTIQSMSLSCAGTPLHTRNFSENVSNTETPTNRSGTVTTASSNITSPAMSPNRTLIQNNNDNNDHNNFSSDSNSVMPSMIPKNYQTTNNNTNSNNKTKNVSGSSSGFGSTHRSAFNQSRSVNQPAIDQNGNPIVPINDLRVTEAQSEKIHEARCSLASLYRLINLKKLDHGIFNHISQRVGHSEYLINPFGLMYYEITASKLLLINSESGQIMDQGTTDFGFNYAGFHIHSAIHNSRPEIKVVIHIHDPNVIACSSSSSFLTNAYTQEACILGPIARHKYHGLVVDKEEQKIIRKSLGSKAKILMLSNHGACVLGETIEEAYHYLYHLVYACESHLKLQSSQGGDQNLLKSGLEIANKYRKKTFEIVTGGDTSSKGKNAVGKMLFEAEMRKLDNLGYRTGYRYANGHDHFRAQVDSHLHNWLGFFLAFFN